MQQRPWPTQKLSVDSGAREVETKLVKSEVSAQTIVNVAEELAASLIVMGSHGRKGIQKLALGSVAEEVLKLSQVPVLIINNNRA